MKQLEKELKETAEKEREVWYMYCRGWGANVVPSASKKYLQKIIAEVYVIPFDAILNILKTDIGVIYVLGLGRGISKWPLSVLM